MTTDIRATEVARSEDISQLKYKSGLGEITLITKKLKYHNLLPIAIKYSLWALRPGGVLTIVDSGPLHSHGWVREVSFSLLRYWVAKTIKEFGEIELIDPDRLCIRVRRTDALVGDSWSLGIIYSGQDAEYGQLCKAIEAGLVLKELKPSDIYICGPEDSRGKVEKYGVNYLPYDDKTEKTSSRFFIAKKKNYLIEAMPGDNVAVIHSRIHLDSHCLSSLPRIFDIISPYVLCDNAGQVETYLSFGTTQLYAPGIVPSRRPLTVRNSLCKNYLEFFQKGLPYIDGGAFFVRKKVWIECKLDPNLAWDEYEDVDWCHRAYANGYLVDLEPRALAYSYSSKLAPPVFKSQKANKLVKLGYSIYLKVIGELRALRRFLEIF